MTTTKDSATDLPQVRLLIDGEWRLVLQLRLF